MMRILLTHAGGSLGIGFSRALKAAPESIHLIGVDAQPFSLQRAVTDEKHLVPMASDEGYLQVLRDLVAQRRPDLLLVLNEHEMAVVAPSLDRLGAPAFMPQPDVIALCQDKMASYERWKAEGIPVPESMMVRSQEDLRAAFDRLGARLWLRKIRGVGGSGAFATSQWETAKGWIDAHQGWGEFMAAEPLAGETVTWECIWNAGELVAAQGRKRLSTEFANLTPSGITGVGGAHEWVSDPAVDKLAQRAIKSAAREPHGLFTVDMTYDHARVLKVTEVNAGRLNYCGSVIHMFSQGVNLPYLAVQVAMGRRPKAQTPLLNPLPQDLILIHGIDIEPLVLSREAVLRKVLALEQRKGAWSGPDSPGTRPGAVWEAATMHLDD